MIERYLAALMDPTVSLLEVHKLMYFAQEAGQPLRLRWAKGPYGPYAENLRHLLAEIEGRLIAGYGDGGDVPDKPLELVPGAIERASSFLDGDSEAKGRFDRVVSLVEGFETPFGMELLASVHWVANQEGAADAGAAAQAVYAWNPRKRQFSPEQIAIAWQSLSAGGWLTQPAAAGAR